MSGKNIQVAIKVRPLLKKEKEAKLLSNWKIIDNSIQLIESQTDPFYFDHIFNQDVSNQIIFDKVAKPIVDATLQGFNGTIFAYGQTSSGKTYTMLGDENNPGVMVLAAKEIFKEIENESNRKFLLRVGYIEIYNEKIYDLLNKNNQDLKIHETPNGDVGVNCEGPIITSEAEMMHYLQTGSKLRKCGETNMNERSSRSHALFRMIIESRKVDETNDDGTVQTSILNLVDLAGSERADQTGATGSRLNEGRHINRSLLYLSCVIKRLSENESDKYINYRDSKLTRILQASLGGNALTAIICTIKPTSVEETNSTLSFAMRAKTIKNKPEVNETLSDAAMMKRLEKEITRLTCELEIEKNKNSKIYANQMRVLQLETKIKEESLKIINSNTIATAKNDNKRRRTWCPSSSKIVSPNTKNVRNPLELSERKTVFPTVSPLITIRDEFITDRIDCNSIFDDRISENSFNWLNTSTNIKSPNGKKVQKLSSLSPALDYKNRYFDLLNEIEELRIFTSLEKELAVEHNTVFSISVRLEQSQNKVAELEKQETMLKLVIDDLKEKALNNTERFMDLDSQILQYKKNFEKINFQLEEKDQQIQELSEKNKELELQCRDKISIEYEYEQFRSKYKNREEELIDSLNEKEHIICRLKKDLEIIRSKDTICNMCNLDINVVCTLRKNIEMYQLENTRVQMEFDTLSAELIESKQKNETLKQIYNNAEIKIESLNLIIKEFSEINQDLTKYKDEIFQNNNLLKNIIHFYEKHNYNKNKEITEVYNENLLLSQDVLNLQIKNELENSYVSFLLQEIQYYINLINDMDSRNITTPTCKSIQANKLKTKGMQTAIQKCRPNDTSSSQYPLISTTIDDTYLGLCNYLETPLLFLNLPLKHVTSSRYLRWIMNISKFSLHLFDDGDFSFKEKFCHKNRNVVFYKNCCEQNLQSAFVDIAIICDGTLLIHVQETANAYLNTINYKNIIRRQPPRTQNAQNLNEVMDIIEIFGNLQQNNKSNILKEQIDKKLHISTKNSDISANYQLDFLQGAEKTKYIRKHDKNAFNNSKICFGNNRKKNNLTVLMKTKASLYDLSNQYYLLQDNYEDNLSLLTKNENTLNSYLICLLKERSLLQETKQNLNILQKEYSYTKSLLNQNEETLESYKNLIKILKEENNVLCEDKNIKQNEYLKMKQLLLNSETTQKEYEIEINNIKNVLRHQTVMLNKYSDQINLLKLENTLNKKQYLSFKNQNNIITLDLKSKLAEINLLKKSNSDYSQIIFNNNSVIKQTETECHFLKESTSKLKEHIITLEEESRLLRIEKANALNNKKQLDCDKNEIEKHKGIICNLNKNKTDLEDKLQNCFAENESLNRRIENINKSFQIEKNKLIALESKLLETKLEKQHLQDSLFQCETKCNLLAKERDSMVLDKVRGQHLMIEIESSRQSTQNDRKCKRQSTHDEKRELMWDSCRTISTMTSPTDQLCGCVQLSEKVFELKKKVVIQNSQIETLRSEIKANPLKDEIKKFQNMLLAEENENRKLLMEIVNLKQQLIDANSTMKESKNLETISTEEVKTLQEDHLLLKRKYQEAKEICHIRIERIKKLEKKIYDLKSNAPKALSDEIVRISKTSEDLRTLCRMRNQRIKELEKEITHFDEINKQS